MGKSWREVELLLQFLPLPFLRTLLSDPSLSKEDLQAVCVVPFMRRLERELRRVLTNAGAGGAKSRMTKAADGQEVSQNQPDPMDDDSGSSSGTSSSKTGGKGGPTGTSMVQNVGSGGSLQDEADGDGDETV
eukprot:Filipodium_phascolosomae@DN5581_c0_g1_i1.p1